MIVKAEPTNERLLAFESVVRAHEVLDGFHRQITAFYNLVDTLLAEEPPLRPINGNVLHISPGGVANMASPYQWMAGWFGRFYVNPVEGEVANLMDYRGPGATELAFVWIPVWDRREPKLKSPECWIGVSDPRPDEPTKSYTASAAVWVSSIDQQVLAAGTGEWTTGKMNRGSGRGAEGFFHALRIPLVELNTEEDVRSRVTGPLRLKFREVFGR